MFKQKSNTANKYVYKKKVLLKLMMVMLLMSQTKYQILLMISLLILNPNLPQA